MTAPTTDYIVSCTLNISRPIRPVPSTGPWQEFEPGLWSGTFDAEIANCTVEPLELLTKPSVFDWPAQRLFIGMQVVKVEARHSIDRISVTRIHGLVLGVAHYGERRISEADARRQLRLPPKELTP